LLAAEAKKNQRLGGDSSTFVKNDKPRISQSIDARKGVAKQFDVSQGYVRAEGDRLRRSLRVASIMVVVLARSSDVVVVLLEKDWVIRAKALAVTGW
jgi:hypothetical protein